MGFCLSSTFPLRFPTGVDSEEREFEAATKVNCTGVKDFKLHIDRQLIVSFKIWTYLIGCDKSLPRHIVCTLTSFNDDGGPLEVYVGVNDGSQKSGSFARNASACSFSICLSAPSSASLMSVSTVVESKSSFRFPGRAAEHSLSMKRRVDQNSPSFVSDLEVVEGAFRFEDKVRWPFSKSLNTRSLAAPNALSFSSSAFCLSFSSRSFCRFISFFCVTRDRNYSKVCLIQRTRTHRGRCKRTPCKTSGPGHKLWGLLPFANRGNRHRNSA